MNKKLENFLINEQILNNFSLYEGTPLEKLFKSNLPEEYQPRSQNWFKLPFYMVPFSSEDKLINVNDLDFISENLVINENSKKYYPFFMHPVTQNAFKGWLWEKYKFVGNDESYFSCTPTSSFRTLLVKNEKTGKHFFVKVTLLDNVGGVFRKIDWESAFNQFQANEIVQKILKDETEVDFFKDIAAFGIRNDIGFQVSNKFVTDFGSRSFYVFANVIRKIPDSLLIDDGKIVCSFSSYTSLLRKEESFLSESLKKSGLDFKKYFEKYIFLPLKKYLLRQCVNQGIIFEPHCQNMMIELNENLIPTGKFFYRDFDSVTFDRFKFSIKNKYLMTQYLEDAVVRNSLSVNYGTRETLAISFFCHFMDDLINPCLISALKSGIISSDEASSFIKKYYSELKEDIIKLVPTSESKMKEIESSWNDDMTFFVDVDISEVHEKLSELEDFDKDKYLRVIINEPSYHKTKLYALENKEIIFNTKNNKIFEMYLER